RRRGLGRPVAAVLSWRGAARRWRTCCHGPPAHQPDFSQSAMIFLLLQGEKEAFHRGFPWFMLHKPGADMSTTEATSTTTANRTGVYLAVLQLAFTLGWTT